MTSISATLNALKSRGIEIEEEDGSLKYFGPRKPTDWELDFLKSKRHEVLALIRARKASPHGRIEPTAAIAEPSFAQLLWMRWLGVDTPEEQILGLNACAFMPDTSAETIKEALLKVLELHEALRYRFYRDGSAIKICLNDLETFETEYEDLSACTNQTQTQLYFRKIADKFSKTPIPADGNWLFRVKLVSLFGNTTAVLLRINHLVADAASLEIIRADLISLIQHRGYEQLKSRKCVRYADFVASEKKWYRAHGNILEDYWKTWGAQNSSLRSPGASQALNWSDGTRTIRKFTLDRALLQVLEAKAGELHSTIFLLLLTALARAIARWSNQSGFAIRTLFDRRTTPELRAVVGLLLGADTVRVEIEKGTSFLDNLQRLKSEFSTAQQTRAPNQYCFSPEVILANEANHQGNVPVVFNCRTLRPQASRPGAARQSSWSIWPPNLTNVGVEVWGRPSAPIVFEFFGLCSHAELHVRLNNEQISEVDQERLIAEFWQTLRTETEACL